MLQPMAISIHNSLFYDDVYLFNAAITYFALWRHHRCHCLV